METTFVAIKPDAVQRGLMGEIIGRFEKKGLKIVGLKLMQVTRKMAEEHYGEHKSKPFFNGLVNFITSGPIVAMAIEGKDAVSTIRKILGATNPLEADLGTMRGDYGIDIGRNIVHGSDSVVNAQRELGIFFQKDEIISNWARNIDMWIYEKMEAGCSS